MKRQTVYREFRFDGRDGLPGRAWRVARIPARSGDSTSRARPAGFHFVSVDTRRMRVLNTSEAERFRADLGDMTQDEFVNFLARSRISGTDRRGRRREGSIREGQVQLQA